MPTFKTGSGVGSTYAAVLFYFPQVDWFKRNILGAIDQLTLSENWQEGGDVGVSFAVEESEKMLETFKMLNFNPFPIGMIFPFGGNTSPDGYLLCDGSSYLETDYPELFSVIGTIYGGSGGSFNVPSVVNNVVMGSGGDYSIGDIGGETQHTIITSEMPSHNHVADNPTIIDPSHSHGESGAAPTAILIGAGVPAPSALPIPSLTAPALTGISAIAGLISDTGGDLPHNNLQPYIAMPYIIYAGR